MDTLAVIPTGAQPCFKIYKVNFKTGRSGVEESVLAKYLLLNKNIVKRTLYPLTDPRSANRSGQALGFVLSLRLQNFARDDKSKLCNPHIFNLFRPRRIRHRADKQATIRNLHHYDKRTIVAGGLGGAGAYHEQSKFHDLV